jgi:hypothetical protein
VSPPHLGRRLVGITAVLAAAVLFVLVGPGLGGLRSRLEHVPPGWLAIGVVLEVLSALSYVVVFRAVFCPRMSWRLSYQIGMAEQTANSVLPVSGAGGWRSVSGRCGAADACRWSSRDHSGDQLVVDRSLFRAAAGAEQFAVRLRAPERRSGRAVVPA